LLALANNRCALEPVLLRSMRILKLARPAARKLLGPRIGKYVRRWFPRTVPENNAYRSHVTGKIGLEIGGPSEIFGDGGPLACYDILDRVDNCLFSARTIWTGAAPAGRGFEYHPRKQPGTQFICDATDLKPIQDASYECILSSHCLEHVANPLRALAEWRRVLRADGLLLLVLPHKDATFDWRRPVTLLAHMIEDHAKNVGEDDLTHLPEILCLHDLTKDARAGSAEQFRARCVENFGNRAMHHHVFDTPAAISLVDYACFKVMRVENLEPYHITILARRSAGMPDNAWCLGPKAEYRCFRPFAFDRPQL
jgi:SAM-dependent methyltransferase